MKRVVAFLIGTGLLLSACETKSPQPRLNCIVLLDFSESISGESFDLYCFTTRDSILKNLGPRDRIVVKPIDYSSEQRSEAIFEADLSQQRFSKPDDGFAHKQEKEASRVSQFLTQKAKTFVDDIRAHKNGRNRLAADTDIIGALAAARADVASEPGANNLVVLLSDMIQESRDLNLKVLSRHGERQVAKLVSDLKSRNLIPDLRGVRILVFGAGETKGMDREYFRAVRSFWMEFFRAAHADLRERDYGYRNPEVIRETVNALRSKLVQP